MSVGSPLRLQATFCIWPKCPRLIRGPRSVRGGNIQKKLAFWLGAGSCRLNISRFNKDNCVRYSAFVVTLLLN